MGLIIAVVVSGANIQDRDGAKLVFQKIKAKIKRPAARDLASLETCASSGRMVPMQENSSIGYWTNAVGNSRFKEAPKAGRKVLWCGRGYGSWNGLLRG